MPIKLKMFSWETPADYLGSKTQVVAQEAFGLVTKTLIFTGTVGAFGAFAVATGGSVAFMPLVTMAPTAIPGYGLLNLWKSSGDRSRDYEWRELFKKQVTKGDL